MTPPGPTIRWISRALLPFAIAAAALVSTGGCVSDENHARARARILRRQGSLSGALAVLRAQSRATGTSAATHLAFAEALLFAQRFREAENAARKAVSAMQADPGAAALSSHDRNRPRRILALVLARTGRLEEAEETLALGDDDADGLVALGLLQLEREDLPTARIAFEQAIRCDEGGPGPRAAARHNLQRISVPQKLPP